MGRAECEHGCLRRQCLVCELTAENRKLRGDVEQAMKAADSAIALLAGPAHDARVSLEARCQRLWGALESCVYELNNHLHSIFGDSRGGVIEALKEAARAMATHRCKVCGAHWRLNPPSAVQPEGSWSLAYGEKCGKCCDNVAMGDQIEEIH